MQYALTFLGAALLVALAIGFGSTFYYQGSPLATTTPAVQEDIADRWSALEKLNFGRALATATFTGCMQLDFRRISLDENDLYRETAEIDQQICDLFQASGASVIKNLILINHDSGPDQYGAVGTVGVGDSVYLITFHIHQETDGRYIGNVYKSALLKDTRTVASLVSIEEGTSTLLEIKGGDAAGRSFVRYVGVGESAFFDRPYRKNADGTFDMQVSGSPVPGAMPVEFYIPHGAKDGLFYSWSDRDLRIETDRKTSPIYHMAGCGLEDGFGDHVFSDQNGLTIAVNTGTEPRMHITTAMAGYVPQQWGTILKTISADDFRKTAGSSKARHSNAPAVFSTIAGVSVKHIGPITLDRSCGGNRAGDYHQYQAVKDGAVVTFTFRPERQIAEPLEADAARIVEKVIGTLTIGSR